jgi:Fe2+ transport system protein FeoA
MKTSSDRKNVMAFLTRWREARRIARARGREFEVRSIGHPDSTGHVEMPLSAMQPGEDGHVLAVRGDSSVRQHLLEMGFTVGAYVQFVRVAPLSDPLTVRIRGYQLSLRRREADSIWMRRCPPEIFDTNQGL